MKQIWNIFRADWKRLTASVVAVVVMLGLCLVPCLYAWFNILSNWDPYGTASTSRIKVAVASEDDGCDVLGLHVNIGELVLRGLESNDQMGWVFVDDAQTALDGVNAGDYYAALILPPEFTGDFVSILEGDLRHPQIQYYENEKKDAIAPKITSKAKTAVQEQINTTILEKVADALTTAGSVFKAMGLDGRDIADGLLEKLSAAQRDMDELAGLTACWPPLPSPSPTHAVPWGTPPRPWAAPSASSAPALTRRMTPPPICCGCWTPPTIPCPIWRTCWARWTWVPRMTPRTRRSTPASTR